MPFQRQCKVPQILRKNVTAFKDNICQEKCSHNHSLKLDFTQTFA